MRQPAADGSARAVPDFRIPEEPGKQVEMVYLHPGQVFVAASPTVLTTILGSCVSVCVWDAEARIGGMNHYLLPLDIRQPSATARYGNVAMEQLLGGMFALGARSGHLRAAVFGGACVLEAFRREERHLGRRNVELARRVLAECGIPVVQEETCGPFGYKVRFLTHEGSVSVRAMRSDPLGK